MKRLVKLAHLEPRQYEELVALLRANGVRFRETPVGLLASGAILVADEDFDRAREILRGQSEAFAKAAREEWQEEWRTQHGRSVVKWFLHRLNQDPLGVIGRVILLIAAVGLFVLFPIWYVLRS